MRILIAVLLLLALAPPAQADTIVFRRGTTIWRMAPDGSGQSAVSGPGARLEWPSASDDGTVVASDETGSLRRFTLAGAELGSAIPTAATGATQDDPAETPTHVRVSPDGQRIAFDQVTGGEQTVLWTPATATALDYPGQSLGQTGMIAPSWIGNGALLVTRDITSEEPGATFSLFTLGQGDDSAEPWFSDTASAGWATGFDAAASRDGRRIAVVNDDAAERDGTPSRLVLHLYTAAAPGEPPSYGCELPLAPSDDYVSTSPTFSPDGSRLAWAESDGIHVATLGTLADCGSVRERVVTTAGAWEPYWTPANPPAGAPGAGAPAAPLKLAVSTRARPRRVTLRKRGLRVRVNVSAPMTVKLTLRAGGRVRTYTRKLASAGATTIHVRVRRRVARRATRLVLRVDAPGVSPQTRVIRPRR